MTTRAPAVLKKGKGESGTGSKCVSVAAALRAEQGLNKQNVIAIVSQRERARVARE